jgi:hypothetical protein
MGLHALGDYCQICTPNLSDPPKAQGVYFSIGKPSSSCQGQATTDHGGLRGDEEKKLDRPSLFDTLLNNWSPPNVWAECCSNSLELLSLISREVERMKARVTNVFDNEKNVEATLTKLKTEEFGKISAELALNAKILCLEVETNNLQDKLDAEDALVEETTMSIKTGVNVDDGENPKEVLSNG